MKELKSILEGILNKGNKNGVGSNLDMYAELENFKVDKIKKAKYILEFGEELPNNDKKKVDYLITIPCPKLLESLNIKTNGLTPHALEFRSKLHLFANGFDKFKHYIHELDVTIVDDNGIPCTEKARINMETWTTQRDCLTDTKHVLKTISKSYDKFKEFIDICWKGVYDKYAIVQSLFKFRYN